LVELYRTTRDARYLELAEIFVNMRGDGPVQAPTVNPRFEGDMCQDRISIREETEAVGHAVLAMYLYTGVADVYAETGEKALIDALERLWANVVDKKMYVTGAVGQAHHGASSRVDFVHEAFIDEYMMPNSTAYNETCANIGNAMFNWRMLSLKGESKYADVVELVLYNSALSGISSDGKHYFYANPLRMNREGRDYSRTPTETAVRLPYIKCFCCPPNLVRTIARSSGWAYSLTENGVAVVLYGGNKMDAQMLDGSKIRLKQDSQYPWDGAVKITIEECKDKPFEMLLRIPEWAVGTRITINGRDAGVEAVPGTFARIELAWKAGDVVALEMPMDITLIEGHPRIEETRNQAAIKRGPVVYCIESPDLPENTGILDVYLPVPSDLKAEYQPELLGGLTTISGKVALRRDKKEGMYRTLVKPEWETIQAQFVPYYSWCNRGQSEMTVWMPIVWK
ncbi:MAG: glycoside hydrolase family 127 protein, partial [Gemmatimonadota bacterium]|nr:glycoside hydrolase family 127 protein [Gemmatimonadota bacterium]